MEKKIAVSFILCAIFIVLPYFVAYLDGKINAQNTLQVSTPSAPINGVYYTGVLTSHRGDDVLCVVPGKVYVEDVGTIVTLNVTVRFKHAQPCPYSDWKIEIEDPLNVEVVNETKTELKDPYTAFKQYKIKVLGNGSIDVVYYYGSGCPYGTEERVTVEFYIGVPNESVMNQSTPSPEDILNVTSINVTGVIKTVDFALRAVVIENYTIEIRGRWTGPNGESLTWRDMLLLLRPGERVTIVASEEDGSLKADVIVINGKTYRKG